MRTQTYDPSLVLAHFLGVPIVGYAPDTFIVVEYDEDAFSKQTGADGETARSRNRNRGGKIRITLMQTSPSNAELQAAAAADQLTGNGMGVFSLEDRNGGSLVTAPEAWVLKVPNMERGKTTGTNEWVLDTGKMEMTHGGAVGAVATAQATLRNLVP